MKKLSINFFKQTEKEEIKKNAADVNESDAHGFPGTSYRIFSAADLWNIQRKGKSVMPRRWSF